MGLDIQNPAIARVLAEALGLKGRVKPSLDSFVIPTFQVADAKLSSYVCESRSCSAEAFAASAGVNEFPTYVFTVPPGVVALVTKLWCGSVDGDATINVSFSENRAAEAGPSDEVFTDQRLIQQGIAPSCTLTVGADLVAVTPVEWQRRITQQFALAFSQMEHAPVNWVIGSGVAGVSRSLSIQSNNDDSDVLLTLEWVEFLIA